MKSLVIGIARNGEPYDGILSPRNEYVSLCGTKPEVGFSINCTQPEFLKAVNGLRYDDPADRTGPAAALSFLSRLVTQVLADLKYAAVDGGDPEPLHLRLVTAPFELAQLPFELAQMPGKDGGPAEALLTHPQKLVTLTREVRQESEARYTWPHTPRILFAWAQPGGADMSVPFAEHRDALKALLLLRAKPKKDVASPEPFLDELLTEVPDASAEAIRKKIAAGIAEGCPYTHVHILAHGGEKRDDGLSEFQLILCNPTAGDKPKKISGEALAKAILPSELAVAPAVISLSVCDSGNTSNTISPSGSLVYQLHKAGIPCVFASQFPLTQGGSVTLVKNLYGQLLNACDPRTALYETRKALKEAHPTHDWASLVTYARFPEDIEEQLQDAQLKNLFGSMKVTNAWVDHVFKFWDKTEEQNREVVLQNIDTRLAASIQRLTEHLQPDDSRKSTLATAALQAEQFGLLGSAYKRRAEYLFRRMKLYPGGDELKTKAREALLTAKEFYRSGLEANPASHWTTMQYLSLKAVTEGTLTDEDSLELWYIAKRMAQREEGAAKKEQDRIWTWGTLAELYLLRPLTAQQNPAPDENTSSVATAKGYLARLAAADAKFNEAKESTARQFERYISWWPELFGETFPAEIRTMATEIRGELPPLDALLQVSG